MNNQKIFLGLLSGAAVGYWLNSDHGRKVRSDAYRVTTEAGRDLQSKISNQSTALKNKAQSLLNQGISSAKSFYGKVEATGDELRDEIGNAYESGKTKVRANINTLDSY
ncbi:MAG: YtxH domain-containing protein [Saprospiraceae bacterium]